MYASHPLRSTSTSRRTLSQYEGSAVSLRPRLATLPLASRRTSWRTDTPRLQGSTCSRPSVPIPMRRVGAVVKSVVRSNGERASLSFVGWLASHFSFGILSGSRALYRIDSTVRTRVSAHSISGPSPARSCADSQSRRDNSGRRDSDSGRVQSGTTIPPNSGQCSLARRTFTFALPRLSPDSQLADMHTTTMTTRSRAVVRVYASSDWRSMGSVRLYMAFLGGCAQVRASYETVCK